MIRFPLRIEPIYTGSYWSPVIRMISSATSRWVKEFCVLELSIIYLSLVMMMKIMYTELIQMSI